jgi:hypothetical protein
MYKREDAINDAESGTFSWILDDAGETGQPSEDIARDESVLSLSSQRVRQWREVKSQQFG